MGAETKKKSSLTVRLDCKTKEDLKILAKDKGLTVSALVSNLIVEQLERNKFKEEHKLGVEKRSGLMEMKIKNLKEKMGW